LKKVIVLFIIGICINLSAQTQTNLIVELVPEQNKLNIQHELIYYNNSNITIEQIVFNDWNNAYSSKNTPLAERFSDEFTRSFHLAKDYERGYTEQLTIIDLDGNLLDWCRLDKNIDIIEVKLREKLLPNQSVKLTLSYVVKIPSDKFTKYGYGDNQFNLTDWFLTPSRIENNQYVKYNNLNLDDKPTQESVYNLKITTPKEYFITSDLILENTETSNDKQTLTFVGKNRLHFSLAIEKQNSYLNYQNNLVEVATNLKDNRLNNVQKAIIINNVTEFVNANLGQYPHEKITVSQIDYERNPFYGLNQLPAFISPFPNEFLFEIKFLKTYLHNYLKNSLNIDARKDNWIVDAFQIYIMMKYIEENHPDIKMMGNISKLKILKAYNLINVSFNQQYSYFYMLMARKNIDQPIGDDKSSLIKFNEQIAGKYRAGLSLKYLDEYLGNNVVSSSMKTLYHISLTKPIDRYDFKNIITQNSSKNIDWFFNTIIDSRKLIDYKIIAVYKDSLNATFTVRNKTSVVVPIPIYGLKDNKIVFKKWLENVKTDSTFTINNTNIDKLVLNYKNEVPEYNLRNNWKAFNGFLFKNRSIKFNFLKDLEDPFKNQILYVPTLDYNLYNGLTPGIRFHNKTLLDKPFLFDAIPSYSLKSKSFTGYFNLAVNQNIRDKELYQIRYYLSGSYFNYASDAKYYKINPSISFRFRPKDLRDNKKQLLYIRNIVVNREQSAINVISDETENYSIFNVKFISSKTEVKNHFSYNLDTQFSNLFGKTAVEIAYRNLFENNLQLNLRFYAGTFLYRKTQSDYYSFGIDKPTDYLFDYGLYGRSESTGFFSQQFINAEGGFKSMFQTRYANQWLTSLNASINIWNWVEIYGDFGAYKNQSRKEQFIYDSGIRLNLVTDYFEVYFPVNSSNGWEISNKNYEEKIRFMITLNPDILIKLFTRKWF